MSHMLVTQVCRSKVKVTVISSSSEMLCHYTPRKLCLWVGILHFLCISFYVSESWRVPGCNSIADLSLKIVFETHKFAVGLIDIGNSESRTHKPKIVNDSLAIYARQILETKK